MQEALIRLLQTVRPAAVAGMFYPGDAQALSRTVAAQLSDARVDAAAPPPKMLLVPHAGFVYSGPVAAHAYARLKPVASRIRRVVLLGPAHRVAVRGLAAPVASAFDTPLGRVPIDRDALQSIAELPQVVASDAAHALEHSLEVQLPFLQAVLEPGFTLVPLVVGRATDDEVAEVLERLWGGDETLILISSDLSHYHPYAEARAIDRATIDRVLELDGSFGQEQACGATPLRGALALARRRGLAASLLDLRNSGDTAGDRSRVVGYAAVAFAPTAGDRAAKVPDGAAADHDSGLGDAVLNRAHNAIARVLGKGARDEPAHPSLETPSATFVTLMRRGELRGCMGTLEALRPLDASVRHHALAAAFRDPRFAPLSAGEWSGLQIEVSVLDAPQPLPHLGDEAATLAQIVPGEHGVVFDWRGRRATFLPQVWEHFDERRTFIAALKRKAGLHGEFWAPDVRLACYRVRKFVAAPIAGIQ